jgi:hypothetical protein
LHSTKWSNKEKKGRKVHFSKTKKKSKNNSMENSVGNEENGYPIPNCNETTINVSMSSVTPTQTP